MRLLFLLLCLANIAVAAGMIWWMPDPMATHFGTDHLADGFMSPAGYAVFMSGLVVLIAVIFLGMPRIAHRMPAWMWSFPNRKFWLSEEHRPETIRRLCSHFEVIGLAAMLFFLLTQWQVFHANQTAPPQLNPTLFWLSLAAFLTAAITLSIRMTRSFRLPKKAE